jgi:hypothetical protein
MEFGGRHQLLVYVDDANSLSENVNITKRSAIAKTVI